MLTELVKELTDDLRCRRCKRVLTDTKSIKRGIGPVCLHKEQTETKTSLKGGDYGTYFWDIVYARETAKRNRMNGNDIWHR